MISGDELTEFRELLESQNLRAVKRNLDFEKRIKSSEGLAELRQWLGKILFDDGAVALRIAHSDGADEVVSFEEISRRSSQIAHFLK